MRAVVAIPVIESKPERRKRFVKAGLTLTAFATMVAALAGIILKFGR